MSSKADILAAIRNNRPPSVELPTVAGEWTTYGDRQKQFIEVLEAVGGQAFVGSTSEIDEELTRLPIYANAQHLFSLVPGIGTSNVDISKIDSPHALEHIDVAILPGEFAVAENAAIWVTDREIPLRVVYFLCQHLVLVVSAKDIIDHMHAAYERIAAYAQNGAHPFASPTFGAFISGPSKTADIEQSLVIGAHGPRSLTVCLLND
jgi:L-lactate dehydrogenase complex protein LldG